MRNLFLALLLANLLLFAWQRWVNPVAEPTGARSLPELPDFRAAGPAPVPAGAGAPPAAVAGAPGGEVEPGCVRIGPLAGADAAAELGRSLAAQGVVATPFAQDGRVWLGNWIQLTGFPTAEAAEAARQQLVAAGLADAYLMQEGGSPVLSLGVFRDRARADRVAATARRLGFRPVTTDRFRPAVEYWLQARVPQDSVLARDALPLPGAQILRVEPAACVAAESGGDAAAAPRPGEPPGEPAP